MYFTAVSAAWRYSGNVTGPDSMLSRPSVMGLPVAFLGVPSAADASGVEALDAEDGVLVPDDDEDDELLPQPATSRLAVTVTASAAAHLLMPFTFVLLFRGLAQ